MLVTTRSYFNARMAQWVCCKNPAVNQSRRDRLIGVVKTVSTILCSHKSHIIKQNEYTQTTLELFI